MKNRNLRFIVRTKRVYRNVLLKATTVLSYVGFIPVAIPRRIKCGAINAVNFSKDRRVLSTLPAIAVAAAIFSSAMLTDKFIISTASADLVSPGASASNLPETGDAAGALLEQSAAIPFEQTVDGMAMAETTEDLVYLLKSYDLWEIDKAKGVPQILFASFPKDLNQAAVETKKQAFISTMLPAIIVALDEVREERRQLLTILNELGGNPDDLVFSSSNPVWQDALSTNNNDFIAGLTRKYRTEKAAELLSRVNVLPVSLILAQGAIESSWGSSRFAKEANNLFGMWTWGKKGLIPLKREAGKTHKIAMYDSILDSVRAYILTINRVTAYEQLRTIRNETLDSTNLSEGLINYSQRKEYYVSDVKRVIDRNNLKGYDSHRLAAAQV